MSPTNPSRRHAWVRTVATAGLALAVIGGAAACSSGSTAATSTNAAVSAAVGASLPAPDFATASAKTGTVLLDVRTPAEFADGHLAGAVNIDIEGPGFATELLALDKGTTYAVYCRSGNRSGVAMQQMGNAGFTSYYDLEGGINAWTANGGQVVTGA